MATACHAREDGGTAGQLPVKLKKTTPSRIEQEVALVRRNGRVLMWQRGPDSRMAGFWELPQPEQVPGLERHEVLGAFRHTITHHVYEVAVISGKVRKKASGLHWIRLSEIPGLPVSTIARKALQFAVL